MVSGVEKEYNALLKKSGTTPTTTEHHIPRDANLCTDLAYDSAQESDFVNAVMKLQFQ